MQRRSEARERIYIVLFLSVLIYGNNFKKYEQFISQSILKCSDDAVS
jgi:hypothetical protein